MHRLYLSFLPFMGDQSREVCGFEGTAQQLPWTKAGVPLWAVYLDFSWSELLVLHLLYVVQVLYVYRKHFQQDGVIPPSSTAQISLNFLICKDTQGFQSSHPKDPYHKCSPPNIFSRKIITGLHFHPHCTKYKSQNRDGSCFVHCTVAVWGCWLIPCCCWN